MNNDIAIIIAIATTAVAAAGLMVFWEWLESRKEARLNRDMYRPKADDRTGREIHREQLKTIEQLVKTESLQKREDKQPLPVTAKKKSQGTARNVYLKKAPKQFQARERDKVIMDIVKNNPGITTSQFFEVSDHPLMKLTKGGLNDRLRSLSSRKRLVRSRDGLGVRGEYSHYTNSQWSKKNER